MKKTMENVKIYSERTTWKRFQLIRRKELNEI